MPRKKVQVYWNLHRDIWSIRSKWNGRVLIYSPGLIMSDIVFRVREGGRKKVCHTGQKNVHAFAEGYVTELLSLPEFLSSLSPETLKSRISYNPYKSSSFYRVSTDEPVMFVESAILWEGRLYEV